MPISIPGRFNRLLQKFLSVKGGAVITDIGGEIIPVFPFFFGREVRFLEGWESFAAQLSIAGVALGVLASVGIGTANMQVLRSFEQGVTTVAGPATLEIAGHDLGVDESAITAVRAIEGVVSAAPVIEESVVVAQGGPRGQALQILGLDLLAEVGMRGFEIPQANTEVALEALLAPDALYLGRQVAADWNLGVGSIVEVTAGGRLVRLRVVGLIHNQAARSSLWDRLAIMDIAAAQLLFQSIGRLDRIELVTTPDRPLDDIVASVRAVLPPHLVVQRPAQRTKQVENMVWNHDRGRHSVAAFGLLHNGTQRRPVQMVEVGMRDQHQVNRRQIAHLQTRPSNTL